MKDKRKSFDSFIIFQRPLELGNGEDKISVYGLLYDRYEVKTKRNDLFIYNLQSFIAYLCACEFAWKNRNCQIFPDKIITDTGKIIRTKNRAVRNAIYKIMNDRIVEYRIVECEGNILYKDDEVEEGFIIKSSLLTRYELKDPIQRKTTFHI